MAATDASLAQKEIDSQSVDLSGLPNNIGAWFLQHRVPIKKITLSRDPDGTNPEDFWLVTDHTGNDDTTFRIIYDDLEKKFGYECLMENDVSYFIGFYGDLKTTLDDLATG